MNRRFSVDKQEINKLILFETTFIWNFASSDMHFLGNINHRRYNTNKVWGTCHTTWRNASLLLWIEAPWSHHVLFFFPSEIGADSQLHIAKTNLFTNHKLSNFLTQYAKTLPSARAKMVTNERANINSLILVCSLSLSSWTFYTWVCLLVYSGTQ